VTPLQVIALIGLPGSGKSTLARRLAELCNLAIVDRDAIRAAMFPVCRFSEREKRAANRAVHLALEVNCCLGRSSVIDGMTLARAADRHDLERLAVRHGALFVPLVLDCPVDLACRRVDADREHMAADRNASLVRALAAQFEWPGPEAFRVDASLDPDAVCRRVAALLNMRRADKAGQGGRG
jgi:hypothetical protein